MFKALEKVLNKFLADFCPDPPLIRKSIERGSFWTRDDKMSGDVIALRGEGPETCWLIVEGQVEILAEGKHITFRGPAELIGEQASLKELIGTPKKQLLAADLYARGPVTLARIAPAFQANLNDAERVVWGQTLAAVVNEKLAEAIERHLRLDRQLRDRDVLLERFAEGEALRLVKTAVGESKSPVQPRQAIVWFSDIKSFSSWAQTQTADDAAALARRLAEIQINLIPSFGGLIDKLLGDGVMAIWFVDTLGEKRSVPRKAIECAQAAVSEILRELRERKLDQLKDPLDVRIGMHCGPTAFGDFGAKKRIAVTVLGDTVNLASRYEQARTAGKVRLGRIRVSPALKQLIDECPAEAPIPFTGPVTVRVKHDLPIKVFWV